MTLSSKHRKMLALDSGIAPEVIADRQYRTVETKKELEELGFSPAQRRAPALLIPLHGTDGSPAGYQLRPDSPRSNRQGKPIKYETPKGAAIRIDCPPSCQSQLADPSVDLWITEGVKKGDALASRGLCTIDLIGVWGFKGKNSLGGSTVLADFDYIAFPKRRVLVVFDSDVMTKPEVALALERLEEHLRRKGAEVERIYLPHGEDGKTGVDDYLAAGHSVDDLLALPRENPEGDASGEKGGNTIKGTPFSERNGQYWTTRDHKDGVVRVQLTNFTAGAVEEVVMDDGFDQSLHVVMEGKLENGTPLPRVTIPASKVNSLDWIVEKWGHRTFITSAFRGAKDNVREILQRLSFERNLARRTIYSHTGWRNINGAWRFLMPGGALGQEGVEVQLEAPYSRYLLPSKPEDAVEAVKASLRFLDIGDRRVTIPLHTLAYLAPLSSMLVPSFTTWIRANSGSFKSTVTSLLACHFGEFAFNTPPITWEATARAVERYLFDLKDCLAWIDDFNPRQSERDMSNQFAKADTVLRSLGNMQGRLRMRQDLKMQSSFPPRALLISTGEIYPTGESVNARTLAIEYGKDDINEYELSRAQAEAHMYPHAMSSYILWLSKRYDQLATALPEAMKNFRARATAKLESAHARMATTVAILQCAVVTFCDFAVETGIATEEEMERFSEEAFDIFLSLAREQTSRLQEENIVERFLNVLDVLLGQQKVTFHEKGTDPRIPFGVELVGWYDDECVYLDPMASYNRVSRWYRDEGKSFPASEATLRQSLYEAGLISRSENGRLTSRVRVNGRQHRVAILNTEKLPFAQYFREQIALNGTNGHRQEG